MKRGNTAAVAADVWHSQGHYMRISFLVCESSFRARYKPFVVTVTFYCYNYVAWLGLGRDDYFIQLCLMFQLEILDRFIVFVTCCRYRAYQRRLRCFSSRHRSFLKTVQDLETSFRN